VTALPVSVTVSVPLVDVIEKALEKLPGAVGE
jgi:hypothetical protein